MIVNSDKRHLETSEGLEVTGFNIDVANPKVFEILSSGLYKNKILAIIREISCNAYDAHVAAGKPLEPITVHMPNLLEPWYSVTDNGPGLDHKDVLSLYSTYFASTKTNSNDFIGAFGLGSKSPFSYVDAFTVTSRFNGKKRIYSAFKAENGLPSITLMHEEDTTEGNGFEVQIPVNSADFSSFIEEARDFYTHFKPTPNIVGAEISINKIKDIIVETNGITVYKHDSYDKEQDVVSLRQGNVVYPLDWENVKFLNQARYNRYTNGYNQKILIDVPIGTFEVTASREGISYTPRTTKSLFDVLKQKAEDLTAYCNSEVDKCASYYDAYRTYLKLNDVFYYNWLLGGFGLNKPMSKMYKGKKLEWKLNLDAVPNDTRFTGVKRISRDFLQGKNRYLRTVTTYPRNISPLSLENFEGSTYYINDIPSSKFTSFVLANRSEFLNKTVYILEGTDPEAYIRENVADFEPQLTYSIKKLSEIGAIPSPDKLKNSIVRGISFDNYYSNDPLKMHTQEKIDLLKGIKYILANTRNGILIPSDSIFKQNSSSVIEIIITHKKLIGIDTSNVYVISVRHFNKLIAHTTAVNFKDEANSIQDKLEADKDVLDYIEFCKTKALWGRVDSGFDNLVKYSKDDVQPTSVAAEVFNTYENHRSTISIINHPGKPKFDILYMIGSQAASNIANYHYNNHTINNVHLNKFYDTYPLLKYVGLNRNNIKEAVEYINLLNK